jgi:hypothetical protein
MSDIRFRNLEKYKVGGTGSEMQLSVPVPFSPTGKTYRECPDTDCSPRLFQMGGAPDGRCIAEEHKKLIRREPGFDGTTCPYCSHEDTDRTFMADMDIAAAKDQVGYALQRDVHDWLKNMTRDFNRKVGRGLLSVSMKVTSPPPSPPAVIREDLLRALRCPICSREYGVYAIALFCPDCGAPALASHFSREIELVGRQLQLAASKEDTDPELSYRLLGNAHEDVLTAFETAQKTVYRYLLKARLPERYDELCLQRVIGNAFQNMERSKALFGNLSIDPYASLSREDLETLSLNIQKRHVIGHNLSIADDRYQALANDARPGQTINLLREDVERFATVAAIVITNLDAELRP